MASDDRTTLSHPGLKWGILWPHGGITGLQLDVVGFLAILGEDAVRKTSRLASLSPTFLLPRLLPAPHSLLYSERPEELEIFRASVTGVQSGTTRDFLSHVGGSIFGSMNAYTVRCCEIRPTTGPDAGPATLTAKKGGPVVVANLFGCALSIALLVLSFVFGDGMSLLATLLLSSVSVFVGIINRWRLQLPGSPARQPPSADIVIRWPNASFLVVKCSEDVARDLFFFPQGINYALQEPNGFIVLSLLGTLFLMISVVALANAKIQLQIAWAASYMVLNFVHWLAAALPRRLNWDLSAYDLTEQSVEGGPLNSNFTEALWKAIILTKSTRWVKVSNAAPQTEVWDEWLHEAEIWSKESCSHDGVLHNPMWNSKDGTGRIWDVPRTFDPRSAWRRIHYESESHAQPRNAV